MQRAPLIHDPRFTRSQFLRLTAAAAGSIAGAGVLGSQAQHASARSAGAPRMGGTIRLGQTADVISFDGPTIPDNVSIWTMLLIYDQLTRPTADGLSIEPGLAESWEVSPDGKTYTFHLRKGVTFHDGSPMTAADVKFSVERAVTLKNSQVQFIFMGFRGMTVVDDYTVAAHLDRPRAPFLSDLALSASSVLPKKLVESQGEKFFQHPIGTGPFMFKSWVKGSQINLVRNPHHFRAPKPYVDGIQQMVVGDDNTRLLQVENGELDICLYPPVAQVAAIKANPNVTVHQDNFFDSHFITLQNLTPHFSDKYVRQAVNYAVDKNAIVQHILFGYGEPSGQAMPKMFGYSPSIQPYPYNPAMAKSLLAKSRYPHGFTTTLLVDASTAATDKPIAELVQEQLKAIGITINIQVLDEATFDARSASKNHEMAIAAMTSDIIDPDELMSFAVVPDGGTYAIWTYYKNPAIDKLAAQAAAVTDRAQRQKIYDRINRMYHDDAPMIFLYHAPSLTVTNAKLQGFKVLATGNYHLEDCWFSS